MQSKKELLPNHVKPKKENDITYFCKLCREYGIVMRLPHLVQVHKAKKVIANRHFKSVIDEIFVESVT